MPPPRHRLATPGAALVLALALGLAACSDGGRDGGPHGGAAIGPADGPLGVDAPFLVDPRGRVVTLHGVNVVDKRPPYLPSAAELGPADVDLMAALGFNTVRLGFIWKGMQPEPGPVDRDYLRRYTALVDLFASRGIHVLVDSHQDLYHESLGGEGAPDWAIFQPPRPPNAIHWGLSYFLHPEVGRAYRDLWNDVNGIQGEYVSMWVELAEHFRDHPGVLGYDLINEPFSGPDWFRPQDPTTLEPFYERLIAAIRTVDDGHVIWWEPSVSQNLGVESNMGSLGGDPDLGLSFHVYCGLEIFLGIFAPTACHEGQRASFEEHDAQRAQQGAAWLLTEFGATENPAVLETTTRVADEHLVGWQYWSWKLYDDPTGDAREALVASDTGPLELDPKVHFLERTYARAVAGTPLETSFDPATGEFRLRYRPRPGARGPTEIWLPLARHYATGHDVRVQGGTARAAADPRLLLVDAAAAGADEVTVVVTRR